ncbi:MAG: hypothetical protein RLZZ67_42 [Candidatus Parcubacteria bacterium]|jgi:hypothetical protein
MRRFFLKHKAVISTLCIVAVLLIAPHFAHALVNPFSSVDIITSFVTGGVGLLLEVLILPLASGMLALGGLLLDVAINFSLHTAYIFSLSPAINLGWTIVRDLCNIFFIFVLIYISLGTIVRGTSFGTKDLLTKVIIAALVINFSLFITKAVVDVSNVFGLWLYGGIKNSLVANSLDASKPASLSDLISTRLGVIQFLRLGTNATENASAAKTVSEGLTSPSQSFVARILRLAVILIATYIFFYCAIIFIARSVTLLFLMVFSPIGFMGDVLPQLKEYANDWRKELTSAAMFPVAFLLMLYIALQFINSLGVLVKDQITDQSVIGGVSISIYFQYFIVIMLLKACLEVAKDNEGKMGKAMGGLADGLGKLAVRAGVAAASGGSALAIRAGLAAATAKTGEGWKAAKDTLPPSPRFIESFKKDGFAAAGKDIFDSTVKAAKSGTWDVRNAKIPGIGKATLGSTLGNLVGVELNAQTAKELKETRGEWAEERKVEEKNQEILAQIRDIEDAKASYERSRKTTVDKKLLDDKVKDAKGKMSDASSSLSNKQLEKLGKSTLSNEHFIQSISQNQAEHLAEKTEASDDDKAEVWKYRLSDVSEALKPGGTGDVSKAIKNHSDKELENLPPEALKDLKFVSASNMNYEKFNNLMKSTKISNATKAEMKKLRYQAFYEAIKSRKYDDVEKELKDLEAPEIAKMDWIKKEDDGTEFRALANPEVLYRLDTKTLGKMYEELSTSQLADVRLAIEAVVTRTPKPGNSDKFTHTASASITNTAMRKRLEKTSEWLLTNNIGKEF